MKTFFILAALTLSGCSGLQYAADNYGGSPVQRFDFNGQSFRIFDVPEKERLMITPSIGRAFGQGATFGAAATAERSYRDAGIAYLKSTGRTCTATDVALVVQPQWEVFYTC